VHGESSDVDSLELRRYPALRTKIPTLTGKLSDRGDAVGTATNW
jgi:hypothetical protein